MYLQVVHHIAEQIRTGRLPVGARLAAERDLADQYGVAVNTIRRAVRELRDQGLVITVPIKGTFVQAEQSADDSAEEGEPNA
ncbi:winged helix-turn-helix transcriptional regulator [Streptomyces sp. LBUM 1478]|uniref:Putative GntR-family transcriptional regulator n=1 Tax=Streptomyces scabiei (strain 87.22) TaxID=680198 RepID=C9Z756_STRSW|nr:GntR family transcriptional regulator [Streptomyces scabiei]MBP5862440.1 winged helix-turn-helix transcriptional regulator [Streptomyces sp. LBUM 1484]MBP5868612.1 winged helix-turn-helix transcriptional regulator [Streptomyces sp. LBUM 1485]MBP5877144.1 winged helix-turn-helix transcriptional regulator [Streptomyces sp. LBUM 1477]MBP5884931.1 winged helix-turn-helix transcriptional regulator [Streptomyces sp. LBUM 1487]MBP5900898.1 winged helix-turn-helix transcriptional regulator [Strepto